MNKSQGDSARSFQVPCAGVSCSLSSAAETPVSRKGSWLKRCSTCGGLSGDRINTGVYCFMRA